MFTWTPLKVHRYIVICAKQAKIDVNVNSSLTGNTNIQKIYQYRVHI